jgi:Peptidase family C25/FlgD Ig-like domain
MHKWLATFFLLLLFKLVPAQRTYKNASVLASGNWYQFSIKEAGVYKIDLAFLNKLGITNTAIPSGTLQIFGNGGAMLPEACNGSKSDDLVENAIQIEDGGDGVFNGSDYILFYANGPDGWIADSVNKTYKHTKNLYSNSVTYFLTLGSNGKRINNAPAAGTFNTVSTAYDFRFFYELDSVNLLSSGKDWLGDELSNMPGKTNTKTFSIPANNIITTNAGSLTSHCVGRSVGSSSILQVSVNNSNLFQQIFASTGAGNYDLFARTDTRQANFTPGNNLTISYQFTPGNATAQAWIDWFELVCRATLSLANNTQLSFRDWTSVGPGNSTEFRIQSAPADTQVWEITNPLSPIQQTLQAAAGTVSFTAASNTFKEYIAFTNTGLKTPVAIGKIQNQNLHSSGPTDFIIITTPSLLAQAQRLALHHQQKDNLKTIVVTASQVYNEFSGGQPDPTAIRDFVKMYYDKAGADTTKRPRYLLLFGDASFDYKDRIQNNTNFIPCYQNNFSYDPLATYTSDDFFGFLDDAEDINAGTILNLLDVGIGRIPSKTTEEATAVVDKIIQYASNKTLGTWRNQQTFIADDEDFNLHFTDAQVITAAANSTNPLFLQEKIYMDAYQQESNAAGSRYPAVNQAIDNQIQNGTLIWNYNGHGGFRRLAEEVVLEKEIVDRWSNANKLPLFITATCDFAPYDNPAYFSLGEYILLKPNAGAIALMTTTRLVFAFSNRIMNRNYLQTALQPQADGTYLTLGEAVRRTKNFTYQTQSDITNNRKFTLLGDPALRLAFPTYKVTATHINGTATNSTADTLKALNKYNISGSISNAINQPATNFNGTLYATVFDKPQSTSTLANDPDSYKENFQVQRNQLFKGKVTVKDGNFSLNFIVPKDINYQPGFGKISFYTENGQLDGNGSFTNFIIGGSAGDLNDKEGPQIKAFLNDEKFVNGTLVNEKPMLLLKLSDSSGINVMGTGIDHNLVAILDNNPNQTYILNNFFEADLNTYQSGQVGFQLPVLEEGNHILTIKAWDVANNSSQEQINFLVQKTGTLQLQRVLNYPNPFTSKTSFWLEHNRPSQDLKVHIQIFTVSGKLVKTIRTTINTPGNRSNSIVWDGTDDYGAKLARGVYIYQIKLTGSDGKTVSKLEKLMIL